MSDALRDLSDRIATRHAAHRPILVAIGPTGGAQALHVAQARARRDTSPLVIASIVEPPPVYSFEPRNPLALPWIVDAPAGVLGPMDVPVTPTRNVRPGGAWT